MKRIIKNSSRKIIGTVTIKNNTIEFDMIDSTKNLKICDSEIIEAICSENSKRDIKQFKEILIKLFQVYELNIGEIAALFNVGYDKMRNTLNSFEINLKSCKGRHNSMYGKKFSSESRKKMSEWHKKFGHPPMYERTPEIRAKISKDVKIAYVEGRLDGAKISRDAWKAGVFDNVNFKKGIGGHMTSLKNNERFFFRSLLELCYIILLEEDVAIKSYQYEPFRIKCEDGTYYTPDFQVENQIIEIKSYKFIYKQGGKIQERFEYKKQQAEKYCLSHNLTYKVIFDTDLKFNSRDYVKYLFSTNYIEKYQIEFLEPARVWSYK